MFFKCTFTRSTCTKVAITSAPTTAVIGIGVNEAVDTVGGAVQDDCWTLLKKSGMLNTGVLIAFFRQLNITFT